MVPSRMGMAEPESIVVETSYRGRSYADEGYEDTGADRLAYWTMRREHTYDKPLSRSNVKHA